MSRTEFNVLEFLMMNVGRVVSKQQILEHVWQYDFGGESTVVETYISYLRKKLDPLGPPMIHTMRGVGYVLRNPAEERRVSLRSRLVAIVLLLIAAGLLASDVATATLLRSYLLRRVDDRLELDGQLHLAGVLERSSRRSHRCRFRVRGPSSSDALDARRAGRTDRSGRKRRPHVAGPVLGQHRRVHAHPAERALDCAHAVAPSSST